MDINEFIDAVIDKLTSLGVKCIRVEDVRDAMIEVYEEFEEDEVNGARRSA